MKRVVVIGGGAAGMMAAISAAQSGKEVILLEKNEKLGKKIFITGKGRCNLTNAADKQTMMNNIVSNPRFLFSSFNSFDNQDMVKLLESEGCPTKVERGNRVFPQSDHAWDVTNALELHMKHLNVHVRLNANVSSLIIEDHVIKGVTLAHGNPIYADSVIVATGGLSYPSTGSTGDGYQFAQQAEMAIRECTPALVPMETQEKWVSKLTNFTLKNAGVTITKNNKQIYKDFGELTFMPYGVSGPTILSASSIIGRQLPAQLSIDLKPALDYDKLDERILRDFNENLNKPIMKVIPGLLPSPINEVILQLSEIPKETIIHDITKQQRKALLNNLKHLTLTLTQTRPFTEAIITQGGVSVKEVNPSTLESKKVQGLFFAGEVLDVDALTGGFNLQIAWSTGYQAGQNA